MTRTPFRIRDRLRSFRYAFSGCAALLRTQPNARIHFVATILVVTAGFYCGLSRGEWGMVAIAMAIVWIAEALNTAIESVADATIPEFHPLIQRAKDTGAAAVLIAAIGAVVIGGLVFGPKVWEMFAERITAATAPAL